MQTTPSNGASNAPGTSSPTTAQVHQGQLQDYELLRSVLREEVGSLSGFSQTLLRPRSFSPLNHENESGQEALQQLLVDPDYRALCKKNNVSPHYLIVTLKERGFVYETSNREGANKIELPLTGNENWQALRTRIEKAATLLGGQIRYDRLISAPRIATFYGLHPWDPANTAEHQAAIDTLEEKNATFQLGLEDDFNILDLKPILKKEDRQVSFQGVLTTESRDELQGQFITGEIKRVIQSFLPEGVTSPLTHLANDILASAMPETVDVQPTVFLQKILQSPEAEKLGTVLLTTMDWYGGKVGEETSPHVRTKVVAQALQIWFKSQTIEYPDRIAGYDLKSNLNWGKSYRDIWREFKDHLFTSRRAISKKEATVMARLFLHEFPTEFRISDIPKDLPYRSSVVWVNFVSGVNFINFTDSKVLYRKTFQQLVNTPLKINEGAKKEQLRAVALARLLPTVEWATTQGLIPQKQHEEYTQTEIDLAILELDTYTNALSDALSKLNKATPERLSIAKSVIDHDFPKVSDKDSVINSFWSDHELAEPARYLNWMKRHSTIDVVADNNFDGKKTWAVIKKNSNAISFYIWLDEDRKLRTGDTSSSKKYNTICNVKELFEQHFKDHIISQTGAYKTLIKSLLSSLTFSDRQALELGTLKIYTLRKETYKVEAKYETPEKILPLRARNGLLLLTTYQGVTSTFELLPRAGVIRRIGNLDTELFGGLLKSETWHIGMNPYPVEVLRHKTLNFDWKAHSTGSKPLDVAHCEAIIEQLGHTFMPPGSTMESADGLALTINSKRSQEISHFIATELLFVDPEALHHAAYGQTQFDRAAASQKRFENFAKTLVPFWTSIEDITSDDTERKVNGAFGLSMDLASFGLPIGKLVSGSIKLLGNASRLTILARLTAFASLTKEVSILTLQALNPVDGVGSLLKALGSRGVKLGRSGIFKIKAMAGKAGHYEFAQSLPQIGGAGRWRPLSTGDRLASVKGLEDVPVRNTGSAVSPAFHAVDPVSGKPFGPSLPAHDISMGPSTYQKIGITDNEELYVIAETAQVRTTLEVDGRTTVFIDNVPYRNHENALSRVDSLDASESLKTVPCRSRRAPEGVCKTRYVITDHPAERPTAGTFMDVEDSWAPWFGDGRFTPSQSTSTQSRQLLAFEEKIYEVIDGKLITYKGMPKWIGLTKKKPIPKKTINARLEFQQGIYGGLKVTGSAEKIDDVHEVGALVVYSKDKSHRYVFAKLHMDDYYMVKLSASDSVQGSLQMSKVSEQQLLEDTVEKELRRIYIGSLNANNMVCIHGKDKVHQALDKLDEYAVDIGVAANPIDELKWVNVTAYSATSLLFDGPTRAMAATLSDGASLWAKSTMTSIELQQDVANRFDTLFSRATSVASNSTKIDNAMEDLQKLIQPNHRKKLRNIAFAEVRTATGKSEVYVSVSGTRNNTRHLPLFAGNKSQVEYGDSVYFNVDQLRKSTTLDSLTLSSGEALLSIPHPITDPTRPNVIKWATSVDSESKLIAYISDKYPNTGDIKSINVVTTLPPCDSCSIILKGFGYDHGVDALNVIWGKRPNGRQAQS
ncbi:deaminase domain-containing protein [Pseudomonas sp. GL-B-26]|uniref:deaminase domain-containing protein n=1 Tax=Pseudomonas sp. GL-B-26 TaxID=2832394 RepID=UPI001CBA9585|nr:deaminase domain-containing protein [Pseudomonas sp. GL-B-26]